MDLLVLGGTAFLGRAVAASAVERGWDVTSLARGSAPPPDGARFVAADRDDGDGLALVADRRWDAVVDVTRQPGQLRRAVRALQADHWVFVSTNNVYARFDRPEQDESSPLLDPLIGDVMPDMGAYGAAKVACEEIVGAGCPSATIVRSGLIGGDDDTTGRVGYYPWRFAHPTCPDVLVPPDPTFPVALIDVRDLASWIVHCVEHRVRGVFNATGPTVTLQEFLQIAREVADATVPPRPVPAEILQQAGVGPWMGPSSLPLWIDDPDWRHFATLDTTAAEAHGLRTRPLKETLAAALEYENRRETPRGCGLSDDEERRLRRLFAP